MATKNVGGRGKSEIKRNAAIAVLNVHNNKVFTYYWLGKVFGIDPKRVSEIVKDTKSKLGGLSTGKVLS